jgi:Tfp pilus assembly protein PilV
VNDRTSGEVPYVSAITSPVVPSIVSQSTRTGAPSTSAGPSPSISTVLVVSDTTSGASKVIVGRCPKSPVTTTSAELVDPTAAGWHAPSPKETINAPATRPTAVVRVSTTFTVRAGGRRSAQRNPAVLSPPARR